MHICVIGTGFVGVVSSGVYASLGHKVIGLDIDPHKIDQLKQGTVPFYEPGLTELLVKQQATGNLSFTTSYKEAISSAEVIIIAVGTPSAADGQADLRYIFASCQSLAPFLQPKAIIAIKSTVPPGTLAKVNSIITGYFSQNHSEKKPPHYSLASLPEFLKEGTAVEDTVHPDRVVIGASSNEVFEVLSQLHLPLTPNIVKISPESAQMAKYSANAYLATRITFINQISDLCQKNGADVQEVIAAISPDKRIGPHYWYPGLGYGGSCFPKDVKELAAYSRSVGEGNNLFNKINELNENRIWMLLDAFADKIGGWEGKNIALLGLSFKPNTNDTREAPSTKIIPYLMSHSCKILGYDPKAEIVQESNSDSSGSFKQESSILKTVKNADVVIAVVEWPEIIKWDFSATKETKKQCFIDARNQFDRSAITKLGYHYLGVGTTNQHD